MLKDVELFKESVVMANELDVAGEFIYAALDKINRMNDFGQVGDDFYFCNSSCSI